MGTIQSIFNSNSHIVRQLPPQISGLYGNSRAGFPLGFGHASSYAGCGVVLIGYNLKRLFVCFIYFFHRNMFLSLTLYRFICSDAAHRIHPLAGMGLNLGFGDVKCLTEILAKAAHNGSQLNDLNYLLDYEQNRLKHNVGIMLGVHGIQRLYNTDLTPIVLARSIGLQITQQMAPVKVVYYILIYI